MNLLLFLILAPDVPVYVHKTAFFTCLPFRESPYAPLMGVHPISAEEAAARNHFRFEYDPLGRVVRISFRLGDKVRNLNERANLFMRAPIMEIIYDESREIRRFYDRHGNPTTIRGGVFQEIYTIGESGLYTQLRFEDISGQSIQNAWGITHYTWETMGDGSVIENRYDSENNPVSLRPGFHFYRLKLNYRADGLLALMQNIDEQNNPVANDSGAAQDRLEFDRHGNIRSWNVLDSSGNPERGNGPDVAHGILSYDQWGNETGIRHLDEKGLPIFNAYGFHSSITTFDHHGNMIGRMFLGPDGKPNAHQIAGYTRFKMEWDETGLERRALYYMDANGNPIMHATRGFAAMKQEYDQQHNNTRTTFLDTAGKVTARIDTGIAIMEHRFDNKGKRTETHLYDADGKPAAHKREGWFIKHYLYDEQGLPAGEKLLDETGKPLQK